MKSFETHTADETTELGRRLAAELRPYAPQLNALLPPPHGPLSNDAVQVGRRQPAFFAKFSKKSVS